MKKFKYLLIMLVGILFLYRASGVNAQVDIELPVPSGDPIFVVENMLPGDTETRQIVVTNSGSTPYQLAVRCEEIEETLNFADVLEFDVLAGAIDIFDGNVGEFCDSAQVSFDLGLIPANSVIVYTFAAHFPAESGNEYQLARYIFDLFFQSMPKDGNLKINEVYYKVDNSHGTDCFSDRNMVISGNGPGSTNIIDLNIINNCLVVQKNSTNISTNVNVSSNSGGNSSSQNNNSITKITSGNANSSVNISFFGGINIAYGACGGTGSKKNDEWIEIFNPTDHEISLKDWTLVDNSGQPVKINSNTKVGPGKFVLISRDSSVWNKWNIPTGTKKVNIGKEFGDGLDNDGDHLYLKDPDGNIVDFTAWGDDVEIWNPAVPLVSLGSSMERLSPGFDTDLPSDWEERNPPTPGQ